MYFAGVLFEDSFLSINLLRAKFFDAPVTKKAISEEAEIILGAVSYTHLTLPTTPYV